MKTLGRWGYTSGYIAGAVNAVLTHTSLHNGKGKRAVIIGDDSVDAKQILHLLLNEYQTLFLINPFFPTISLFQYICNLIPHFCCSVLTRLLTCHPPPRQMTCLRTSLSALSAAMVFMSPRKGSFSSALKMPSKTTTETVPPSHTASSSASPMQWSRRRAQRTRVREASAAQAKQSSNADN